MNNLPEDTLNIISSFLHNLSCCRKSDFHNFSLINKFFYNMYKEKLVIVPPIHNHIILSIYKKNMIHQLKILIFIVLIVVHLTLMKLICFISLFRMLTIPHQTHPNSLNAIGLNLHNHIFICPVLFSLVFLEIKLVLLMDFLPF